ncbi:hypothetical protein [Chryseobacterium daeguense]|uniref:hypothetical protein n=1 Tax=Chryseobacterium daeguense TaxID=412438 RepID=UPI00040BBEC0|nr:hypothetical protein [Chryseobacterium daeguense]
MGGATGICPAAGFLINSYFVDLPNNGGGVRIHANSPSNCGSATNHSALWRTTVTIPAGGQAYNIAVGRGQGGNYQSFVDVQLSSRIIYKKVF